MRTKDPMVSCLCVTRNRPRFVEKAAEIFLSYTWKKKELLVLDDSDPDKRADLSGLPGVRHLLLDHGGSPDSFMGEKHNIGLREANGEVIAYHDDDDWFSPRRLTLQLEPIVMGDASITGFARDFVAKIPACTFWKFKPASERPSPRFWLKNGMGQYRLGLHDGTAMFHRDVLRHGIEHPPYKVRQKVKFLDDLAGAGEKWVTLPNNGNFVYVRHDKNTWHFLDSHVLYPVGRPWWLPQSVTDFWKEQPCAA